MNASMRSPGPNGGSPHIIKTSTSLASSSRVMPNRSHTSDTVASGCAITHGTRTRIRFSRSVVRSAGIARLPGGWQKQCDDRAAKLGRLERDRCVCEARDPCGERIHVGDGHLECDPAVLSLFDAQRARTTLGPPGGVWRERHARDAFGLPLPWTVRDPKLCLRRGLEVGPRPWGALDETADASELELAH